MWSLSLLICSYCCALFISLFSHYPFAWNNFFVLWKSNQFPCSFLHKWIILFSHGLLQMFCITSGEDIFNTDSFSLGFNCHLCRHCIVIKPFWQTDFMFQMFPTNLLYHWFFDSCSNVFISSVGTLSSIVSLISLHCLPLVNL